VALAILVLALSTLADGLSTTHTQLLHMHRLLVTHARVPAVAKVRAQKRESILPAFFFSSRRPVGFASLGTHGFILMRLICSRESVRFARDSPLDIHTRQAPHYDSRNRASHVGRALSSSALATRAHPLSEPIAPILPVPPTHATERPTQPAARWLPTGRDNSDHVLPFP
jgi:hypothetical protein